MQIQKILHIPIVRQLLGGIGGALVALTVYTAYGAASDVMQAYVLKPEIATAKPYQNEEKMRAIAEHARAIMEQLRAQSE